MTDDRAEIRGEVIARLVEVIGSDGLPADEIKDDHRLSDDLGLASLDAVMLTLELEDRYGIEVADQELTNLDTVASLLSLVESKLSVARSSSAGSNDGG